MNQKNLCGPVTVKNLKPPVFFLFLFLSEPGSVLNAGQSSESATKG